MSLTNAQLTSLQDHIQSSLMATFHQAVALYASSSDLLIFLSLLLYLIVETIIAWKS